MRTLELPHASCQGVHRSYREYGRETNIGKDCGKTYFGVDFEILSGQFERDLAASQNREALASFAFNLDELEARIGALRQGIEGPIGSIGTRAHSLSAARGCSTELVRRVERMVRSRDPEVTIDRRATEDEIEQIEVRENRTLDRPHYVSGSIGRIAGLEALYAENDLKQLLVLDLETHIAEFRDVVITDLTHSELRRWGKWAATVESTLERAQASVTLVRRS